MNQLLKLISKGGLKDAGTMLKWTAAMPMQFMPGSEKNLKAQRDRNSHLRFNPNRLGLQGYWHCFLYALPILGNSFTNSKLRKEFASQLTQFFLR